MKEQSTTNETEAKASNSYLEESKLNDMKQHADKIIQGIKALNEKDAARAIWELFQNAVDLSEKCDVVIEEVEDRLIFQHNGEPFFPNTLDCLFKQVSSKTLEDKKVEFEENVPVGQYGTGFITTHCFGKVVDIDGALLKDGGYVPLTNFRLDRSTDNWKELRQELGVLRYRVANLLEVAPSSDSNLPPTSFTFHTATESNKTRVRDALDTLRNILPYVMTLNSRLQHVKILRQNGESINFSRGADEVEGDLSYGNVLVNNEPVKVPYLKSEDKRVTVLLPLDGSNNAVDLDDIPRLFLYYPLVGTQNLGVNFLFHSRNFLPLRDRDGLYLESHNEENQTEEIANQNLISKASETLFDFLEDNLNELQNPVKLAKINFLTKDENDNDLDYMVKLKSRWVERFKSLPLVEKEKGRVSPSEATFLKRDLLNDQKYFDSVYALTSKFYSNMPKKSVCAEWTQTIEEWGIDDVKWVGFEELTTEIEAVGNLKDFNQVTLKAFYQLIINSGEGGHFANKKLLPNIKGEFRTLSALNKSVSLPDTLIEIADVLNPDVPKRHIHPEFILGLELNSFGRKNYISEINSSLNEHTSDNTKGSELSEKFRNALIRLSSITSVESSVSVPSQMAEKICEFYQVDYAPTVITAIKEDELNLRTPQRRIVRLFLNDISLQSDSWVKSNIDFLEAVVRLGAGHDYYKEMFNNIAVFPNQLFKLKLPTYLYRDSSIPDHIKNTYDTVIRPDFEIRSDLVDMAFSKFLSHGKAYTAKDLTAKVEERFYGDAGMDVSIMENPYRSKILEIIKSFNSPDSEASEHSSSAYKDFYPRTYENKSKILVDLADGEDTFSILSLDKEDISRLGGLAKNPQALARILRLGEEALKEERRQKANFQHKYKIGTNIENLIRQHLSEEVSKRITVEKDRKLEADNVQDGQDIVIKLDNQPVYFIEVKSRWDSKNQVTMSKNQLARAVEQAHRYALCSVDVTKYEGNGNKYDLPIEEILPLSKFVVDVGSKVKPVVENNILAEQSADTSVHLIDYRGVVPQEIIKHGKEPRDFVGNNLLDAIKLALSTEKTN